MANQSLAQSTGSNLERFFADPWSIFDTANGDPRLHAYRRIALGAYALGLSLAQIRDQVDLEGEIASLEAFADRQEAVLDARCYA